MPWKTKKDPKKVCDQLHSWSDADVGYQSSAASNTSSSLSSQRNLIPLYFNILLLFFLPSYLFIPLVWTVISFIRFVWNSLRLYNLITQCWCTLVIIVIMNNNSVNVYLCISFTCFIKIGKQCLRQAWCCLAHWRVTSLFHTLNTGIGSVLVSADIQIQVLGWNRNWK